MTFITAKDFTADQAWGALGIANMGGAFFQAYPAMGSFSQSAINDETGGKTGVAFFVSVTFLSLTFDCLL